MCNTSSLSRKAKIAWFEKGQRRCHCGVQLVYNNGAPNQATTEHLVPRSSGGKNYKENLIVMCRTCNEDRGNSSFVTWVLKNDLPKADWLIEKYSIAIRKHIDSGCSLGISRRDIQIANKSPSGKESLRALKQKFAEKNKRIINHESK